MATLKRLTLFGLSFWMLAACHLVARTPAPQPTSFPPSTNPSTPILPIPTTPPLTVLTKYLENVRIVNIDTFDDPAGWTPGNGISNGELLLTGVGSNVWHGLSNRTSLLEGDGIVIKFNFTPGEFFEMYFEREPWNTSLYKRFGVYLNEDHANINIFLGRTRRDPNPISGNLSLVPGTWYSLFLVIGKGGDFLAVLWDPANPERNLQYREVIESWQGLGWTFRVQVNTGTIVFDDFEKIEFDGIR